MTTREIQIKIDNYEALCRELGVEPALDSQEVDELLRDESNMPQEYVEAIDLARSGDASKFQQLPLYLRNYLGALAVREFVEAVKDAQNPENEPRLADERVRKYLEDNAMNAVFRAGMSAGRQDNKLKREFDEYMSRYLLQKTLMPPTDEERQNLKNVLGDDEKVQNAVEQNMAKQRVLAKQLFMAQLGAYYLKTNNKDRKPHTGDLSQTLVHGGRTQVVLPFGGDQNAVMNAVLSDADSAQANVYKRGAASHSVKRREILRGGIVTEEGTEYKAKSPSDYLRNHYGMDFATGGLGMIGPDKKPVQADGVAGHLYIRKEPGDETHCGSVLFGFESSAPSKTSYTGHKHTFRATSSKQSPFLAGKGGVGRKIDGRTIDLSGISPEDFVAVMQNFDEKYAQLQNGATTPEGRAKLAEFNKMLTGKILSPEKLLASVQSIGMDGVLVGRALDAGRNGLENVENRLNPATVTREEFANEYRKRTTSEDAIDLATKRFIRANDSTRAVGAIKELQKVHNTRTLGWKILHPISNYRENKTIKTLISQLYDPINGHAFTALNVYRAFASNEDTYTMDYGEGLNNRDGVRQMEKFADKFKKDDVENKKLENQFREMGEQAREMIWKKQYAESLSVYERNKAESASRKAEEPSKKVKSEEDREIEKIRDDLTKKIMGSDRDDIEKRANADVREVYQGAIAHQVVSEDQPDEVIFTAYALDVDRTAIQVKEADVQSDVKSGERIEPNEEFVSQNFVQK